MEQDNQPKDKEMTQRISTISAIMGIVMTAIYMGMSFLLLFTNLFLGLYNKMAVGCVILTEIEYN